MDLPRVIAHRGAPRLAPENTLDGLAVAKAHGAQWTEFDVTLSADGIPMVIHDDTLERTTNGHGAVSDYTAAELSQLSAGAWFGAAFTHCRLPTLAQYLQAAAELGLGINVELKPIANAQCAALCQAVLDTLASTWPTTLPTPLLSSFSADNLRMLRRLNCPYPLAFNTSRWSGVAQHAALELGCFSLHANAKYLTITQVEANSAAGLKTLAYTVNDADTATKLFAWGVSAVFSDIPDLLTAEL